MSVTRNTYIFKFLCSGYHFYFILYINKSPTGCNSMQSVLFHRKIIVHVSGVIRTHQVTQNCIYSLRYRSYYRCSYLLATWQSPDLATLEGGSCTDNMICNGGCKYIVVFKLSPCCRYGIFSSGYLPRV
jgi:hypothetical protein